MPVGKAGYHLPRTISSALSTSSALEQDPIPIAPRQTHSTATSTPDASASRGRKRNNNIVNVNGQPGSSNGRALGLGHGNARGHGHGHGHKDAPQPAVFRIGRSVVPASSADSLRQPGTGAAGEPGRPVNLTEPTAQGAASSHHSSE